MQKLIRGIHKFKHEVFDSQVELFKRLANGQNPQVLFITCSDSRINPNLFTQTDPGDLFIMRNAGNIIPPYGSAASGETATIEFAVEALGVKDIVICGHSLCGAMNAIIKPHLVENMPAMRAWLKYAEQTKEIVSDHYKHLEGEDKLMATVEENVLTQIKNLKSHPSVAAKLEKNELRLHAWVYKIETGVVFKYESESGQFVPLTQTQPFEADESSI